MFAAEDINLKPIFGAIIANFYNTSVDKVNFANGKDTVDIINNFVNEKTSGLIPELFDEQALVIQFILNTFSEKFFELQL